MKRSTLREYNKNQQCKCCYRWHFIFFYFFSAVLVQLFWHTSIRIDLFNYTFIHLFYLYLSIYIYIIYIYTYYMLVCLCRCKPICLCWHVHSHIGVNAMLTRTKTMLNTYVISMWLCVKTRRRQVESSTKMLSWIEPTAAVCSSESKNRVSGWLIGSHAGKQVTRPCPYIHRYVWIYTCIKCSTSLSSMMLWYNICFMLLLLPWF